MSNFSFDNLGDIFTPKDLIIAGFPGGKGAVYALFHRKGFPVIENGRKYLVSKKAFIEWLERQTSN